MGQRGSVEVRQWGAKWASSRPRLSIVKRMFSAMGDELHGSRRRAASGVVCPPASYANLVASIPFLGTIIPAMGITDSATALGNALFSGLQQRLLSLLFGQPARSFYGNELLRLTASGRGALQRELEKLVSSGLVTVTQIGNQKHYQANPEAPIFQELRSIVVKTFGLADVLKGALEGFAEQIRVAFIYGSVAKGSDTASSDVDLFLVSDELGYTDLYEVLVAVEAQLGRRVNPTLYTSADLASKLQEGNSFVLRVLEQAKIFLIGDGGDLPTR